MALCLLNQCSCRAIISNQHRNQGVTVFLEDEMLLVNVFAWGCIDDTAVQTVPAHRIDLLKQHCCCSSGLKGTLHCTAGTDGVCE